jgi:hypothetical protein
MSLIDLTHEGLDESVEPTVMDAGSEVELMITSCRVDSTEKGDGEGKYLLPMFEVVGEPYVKEFSHFMWLPDKEMSPKKLNKAKNDLEKFFRAFDFDYSRPFDPEDDLPGCKGWAILGVRSDDFGEQNTVRQFVLPK